MESSRPPLIGLHSFETGKPCDALAPYVRYWLAARTDGRLLERYDQVRIPDGELRLCLLISRDAAGRRVQAVVTGGYSRARPQLLHGVVDCLVYVLRAGAVRLLTGVGAGDLADQRVPVAWSALWGSAGAAVVAAMADADDASRRALLESFLCRRLHEAYAAGADAVLAMRLVDLVRQHRGLLPIGRLAAVAGVGTRRLQRIFTDHVGLSAKRMSRLARLHATIGGLVGTRGERSLEAALDGGYYDQSHCIAEFREVLATTPARFARRISQGGLFFDGSVSCFPKGESPWLAHA